MVLAVEDSSVVHNCLLDFLQLTSADRSTYLHYLLGSLENKEGVALEYSGVYLDGDLENTPEIFQGRHGITFSFMDDAVTVTAREGVALIIDWCRKNSCEHAGIDWEELLSSCARLEEVYGL